MSGVDIPPAPGPRWALLNFVREGSPPDPDDREPNVHMTTIRGMGAEEVAQLQAAITAVTSLRSASQVRPFEEATRNAMEVMDRLIAMGTHAMDDPEDHVLPNLVLDQWLSQAVITKSRMLRDANRCLGGHAKKWLSLAFDDLYQNHPDWRMVHEWRNASQHRLPSLQLTQFHVSAESESTWTMNPQAVDLDVGRGGKWPNFVLDRIDQEPDLRDVMRSTWDAVANLYAGFLVTHEEGLSDLTRIILTLLAEGQSEHPGGRVVSEMTALGAAADSGYLHWDGWIPLRYPAVEALAIDLDTASERLSRVRGT